MLLGTPLLRYYLEKGLSVGRVYEVIEFTADKVFSNFVNRVTEGRRAYANTALGNTFKLVGNSG